MLSGRYLSACRRFLIFAVSPSSPVLKIEYITIYGFASGPTERTSTRILFSLPIGMRTMEPRSVGEALIWFGASKCGSNRRYALTLAFSIRQMSLAWVRIRSMNDQPALLSFSSPLASQNRFLPFLLTETLVCMPLPLTPTTGFGKKEAVSPILVATWRQTSL